jgi:hypothetical protein
MLGHFVLCQELFTLTKSEMNLRGLIHELPCQPAAAIAEATLHSEGYMFT